MEQNLKNFLETKITYSWYKNAKIDYNISGKFLNIKINEHCLTIFWDEMGKKYKMTIPCFREYTYNQIYDIWMELDYEVFEV